MALNRFTFVFRSKNNQARPGGHEGIQNLEGKKWKESTQAAMANWLSGVRGSMNIGFMEN